MGPKYYLVTLVAVIVCIVGLTFASVTFASVEISIIYVNANSLGVIMVVYLGKMRPRICCKMPL